MGLILLKLNKHFLTLCIEVLLMCFLFVDLIITGQTFVSITWNKCISIVRPSVGMYYTTLSLRG
jgi:hypothetical protein